MGEMDYQTALLLQNKFNSEVESTQSDYHLAMRLQESETRQEIQIIDPPQHLTTHQNDGKCLVDPSWELEDPTPDIHGLFLAFNKQFFWNKLLSACVSWSKRMTSCAGICSYHRGGLCSITLSEPLLKLRSRKDLVETLLHEMIHAFLFITHNNRDRSGHGPEFCKHMRRINQEAGTKITIYHSFHDEVRLYKTHWWRCNGPCQYRKPFFGEVHRSMNRAPGPNDFWWAEHKRTCGGTFIKVKEPAKAIKIVKGSILPKSANAKGQRDIRTFFSNGTCNTKASSSRKNTSRNIDLRNISSLKSKQYSTVRNHWANKFLNSTIDKAAADSVINSNEVKSIRSIPINCPVCNIHVDNNRLNSHLDKCLKPKSDVSIIDLTANDAIDINVNIRNASPQSNQLCPACGKVLKRQDIKAHLSNCIKWDMFKVDNISGNRFECPICLKLCEDDEKNQHIDNCIQTFGTSMFDDDFS